MLSLKMFLNKYEINSHVTFVDSAKRHCTMELMLHEAAMNACCCECNVLCYNIGYVHWQSRVIVLCAL